MDSRGSLLGECQDTVKTVESEIDAGRWPREGSKKMRERVVQGTVKFMDSTIGRIKAINNGSTKGGSLSTKEMRLVAAHLPAVLNLESKVHRSVNMAALTVDHIPIILGAKTGPDVGTGGAGCLVMVEQKPSCKGSLAVFPTTDLLKREFRRYQKDVRPFLARKGRRPSAVIPVKGGDLAHFDRLMTLPPDEWFLLQQQKNLKKPQLQTSSNLKAESGPVAGGGGGRRRSRPRKIVIYEDHPPPGRH